MKKRTQIEAELAQLALEIGGKSHSEAAKAVLDLYKGLALLEAEETIERQLAAAQQDMQSQLRAKIAELQSEVSVPEVDVPTPAPEAPVVADAVTTANPEEEDNQLSLVDVAEEIEKEEAAKAAQVLPEEVKESEEPVLKSHEDRTVFQLDEAVVPAPAAPEPPAENTAEPTSDSQFGMQDVSKHYHLGSFHQSQEMFEIPMNTKRLNSLSPAHQAILRNAAYAANSDNYFKALVRYSQDLSKLMNEHKVNVYQTSDAILAEQLKGWDKVIGEFAAKDAFFKKVVDSQKAYAKRTMKYLLMNQPNYKLAYENEFGPIEKVKI